MVINMEKIIIGEKEINKKYDFRETCFGICEKDGKLLLVNKNNQYSLIGGGIEQNETKEECLKREFLEEAGCKIKNIKELITIDCFWLAGGTWPLESLANIFVVEIEEERIKPTEEGHIVEEVLLENALDLLPLPYHKEAIKYYLETINQKLK